VISDGPLYRPQENEKVLVNAGSVGQPRDRDNRACWCLVDSECSWIEFIRVEYDIDRTQDAMRKENLPLFLIERLGLGR
jgi:diadenosine tetraphosphatase ApaH/serine/threonine PP2A family protein phosphatase